MARPSVSGSTFIPSLISALESQLRCMNIRSECCTQAFTLNATHTDRDLCKVRDYLEQRLKACKKLQDNKDDPVFVLQLGVADARDVYAAEKILSALSALRESIREYYPFAQFIFVVPLIPDRRSALRCESMSG